MPARPTAIVLHGPRPCKEVAAAVAPAWICTCNMLRAIKMLTCMYVYCFWPSHVPGRHHQALMQKPVVCWTLSLVHLMSAPAQLWLAAHCPSHSGTHCLHAVNLAVLSSDPSEADKLSDNVTRVKACLCCFVICCKFLYAARNAKKETRVYHHMQVFSTPESFNPTEASLSAGQEASVSDETLSEMLSASGQLALQAEAAGSPDLLATAPACDW